MNEEREARIRAAIAEMRAEYLRELPEKLAALVVLAARAKEDDDAFREARMEAHRIFGTAGSLGLDAVSAAAGRMERAMMAIAGEQVEGDVADAWRVVAEALGEMQARQHG